MTRRTVEPRHIVRGQRAVDGAGVRLQRVLGIQTVKDFDPFLMLDGFDSHNPADYIAGFPFHPHRGIETITYLVSGEIEHSDSLGNKGTINSLGCQWMTAGSGIIHQEMPKPSPHMLGLQLWVNLPQKDKMTDPAYGDITADGVPVVEEPFGRVHVLSGKYKGTAGAFKGKFIDVTYFDVELNPNEEFVFSGIPNDQTVVTYLLQGTLAVEGDFKTFESKGCAVRYTATNEEADAADEVVVKAGMQGARFVFLAGKPLREPVAWGGPIVMNTRAELQEAFDELDRGTFVKHAAH